MQLTILSHKETWRDSESPSDFATIGGFPFQMKAISELFDRTILMVPVRSFPAPPGLRPMTGHNMSILALDEPAGRDLRRKISIITWLPVNLSGIWRNVRQADAVHAPIPGDIGTIGLLVALAQRKPLFVRHCGSWGNTTTLADRFLNWLLPRIAGGRNVVMATGGGDTPPCPQNTNIQWIFSTTLTQAEYNSIQAADPWQAGQPLRLVTASRLAPSKNTAAILHAFPQILDKLPNTSLDVLGEGDARGALEQSAAELGIGDRVRFHGNVPHEQVIDTLSHSHIFVFPTQVKEGFPKAVLEAMACGLPVIASDVSVIPHLIGVQNGCILADTTPEAVSQAVLNLTSNPRRLSEMSASARETAGAYTLEAWRDTIGEQLQAAWGPLSEEEHINEKPYVAA